MDEETQLDVNIPEHMVRAGLNLRDQNELVGAKACFLRAIGLDHDHADAHLALAEVLLATGEYETGFREFQWRMRTSAGQKVKLPTMTSAPWNGMALPDSKLLLIADQGFGDSIQFARYIPIIKGLGLFKEIVVACSRELQPVFAAIEGVDECYSHWGEVPPHAAHALFADLPYLLHTAFATVPWYGPYIHSEMRSFSSFPRPVRRVGIVWSGRPTPDSEYLSRRSMPLHKLRPLTHIGRELVSLQKVVSEEDAHTLRAWGVPDWGRHLDTFADTVELLDRVDCVVTIDTCVAHLAGAMGIQTMVMTPYAPDWRWIDPERPQRTPWYPHTRVFRQLDPGDWDSAIAPVCALLGH